MSILWQWPPYLSIHCSHLAQPLTFKASQDHWYTVQWLSRISGELGIFAEASIVKPPTIASFKLQMVYNRHRVSENLTSDPTHHQQGPRDGHWGDSEDRWQNEGGEECGSLSRPSGLGKAWCVPCTGLETRSLPSLFPLSPHPVKGPRVDQRNQTWQAVSRHGREDQAE